MTKFIKNLHYAWTHGNESEEFTEYDIIGALCACVIIAAILLVASINF